MFLSKGGKYTHWIETTLCRLLVKEGEKRDKEQTRSGNAAKWFLDRSVVVIVEGKCRGSYGIRWRVTSGGIARGSSAVAIGVGVCRTASDGDGYRCQSDSWWRWSYCSQTALGSGTVG